MADLPQILNVCFLSKYLLTLRSGAEAALQVKMCHLLIPSVAYGESWPVSVTLLGRNIFCSSNARTSKIILSDLSVLVNTFYAICK